MRFPSFECRATKALHGWKVASPGISFTEKALEICGFSRKSGLEIALHRGALGHSRRFDHTLALSVLPSANAMNPLFAAR
jgi:hypothetical protein